MLSKRSSSSPIEEDAAADKITGVPRQRDIESTQSVAEEALMTNGRRSSDMVDVKALGDRALNHDRDQLPDIKPELRRLNVVWVRTTARELVSSPASAALLGGAALSLLRGKFLAASLFATGLFIQQAMTKRIDRGAVYNVKGPNGTAREDLEIERYALKVQRGDYGKLEVIPFK